MSAGSLATRGKSRLQQARQAASRRAARGLGSHWLTEHGTPA